MLLYTNGCSYTCGAELISENINFAHYQNYFKKGLKSFKSMGLTDLYDFTLERCFPYIVSRDLGFDLENDAENGSSNYSIMVRSITTLNERLTDRPSKDIFCLINWTGFYRDTFLFRDNELDSIVHHSKRKLSDYTDCLRAYYSLFSLESTYDCIIETLSSIVSLKSFLELNNISYLFTFSLSNLFSILGTKENHYNVFNSDTNIQHFIKEVLNSNYHNWNLDNKLESSTFLRQLEFSTFSHFCVEKKFPFLKYYHPNAAAHRAWATLLARRIHDQI